MNGKEALEHLKSLTEEELNNVIHVEWWELSDVVVKRDNMLNSDKYNAEEKQRLHNLDNAEMMGILKYSIDDHTKYSDVTRNNINKDISYNLECVADGTYFENQEEA